MKTKEELDTLKEEVETVSKKLHELTDDELAQVTGGRSVHPDASAFESLDNPGANTLVV